MTQTLRSLLPPRLVPPLRRTYLAFRRLPELPGAYLHPWRRRSRRTLAGLRDHYAGQRAFIIGNGPSLRQTDLSRLANDFTFGLNRIYLMFAKMGFSTSCLVAINDLVIEQCINEMQELSIPRFFSWHSRRYLSPSTADEDLPVFLYTTYESPGFARDVRGRVWEGATVTYVALQLAFHMGFSPVILIGVDHDFASKGVANTTVTSTGEDPNHFSPQYFGKGFRWQLPDLDTSAIAYRMARQEYERAGREVIDATVGGKLTVFPKVKFESLFK
jgi:6-hydroxymethylpterin diphosphokinase MptE-like